MHDGMNSVAMCGKRCREARAKKWFTQSNSNRNYCAISVQKMLLLKVSKMPLCHEWRLLVGLEAMPLIREQYFKASPNHVRSSQCFKNLDLSYNSLSSIMTIIIYGQCFCSHALEPGRSKSTSSVTQIIYGMGRLCWLLEFLASSKVCPKMQRLRPCRYIDARTRGIGLPQALEACHLAISFCGPRKTAPSAQSLRARAQKFVFRAWQKGDCFLFLIGRAPFEPQRTALQPSNTSRNALIKMVRPRVGSEATWRRKQENIAILQWEKPNLTTGMNRSLP